MGVLTPYYTQLTQTYPASTSGGGTADLTATNALLTQIRDGDITANVDIADMEVLLTEIRDKDYAADAVALLTAANALHTAADANLSDIRTASLSSNVIAADSNTKLNDTNASLTDIRSASISVASSNATMSNLFTSMFPLIQTLVNDQMPAQAVLLEASNQLLTDTLAKLEKANGLIPDEYDDITMTYVAAGLPAEGEIKTALFKLLGTDLVTLTLNYDGAGALTNVNAA